MRSGVLSLGSGFDRGVFGLILKELEKCVGVGGDRCLDADARIAIRGEGEAGFIETEAAGGATMSLKSAESALMTSRLPTGERSWPTRALVSCSTTGSNSRSRSAILLLGVMFGGVFRTAFGFTPSYMGSATYITA